MSEFKISQADLTKVLGMRPGQGFHIEATGAEHPRGSDGPRQVALTALLRRERDGVSIVNLDVKREPRPAYEEDLERATTPSPVSTAPSTPEAKAAARQVVIRPPAKPPARVAPPSESEEG
jgi:hypothetical protein